jgi:hypothetical protein
MLAVLHTRRCQKLEWNICNIHMCHFIRQIYRSVPCPCRIPRNPMIVRFQYVSPNSWRACIGHRLEASWTGQLSAHRSGSPWSGHEGNLHRTHGCRAHGRSGLSKRYAKTMDTSPWLSFLATSHERDACEDHGY